MSWSFRKDLFVYSQKSLRPPKLECATYKDPHRVTIPTLSYRVNAWEITFAYLAIANADVHYEPNI